MSLAAQHRPGRGAPRRVADAGRPVADDEHRQVAGVLELAQLAEHDRVAQVDVGRGRVDPELDAQRAAERQLALELAGREHVDRAGRKALGVAHARAEGLGEVRRAGHAERQGRSAATEMPMRGPIDGLHRLGAGRERDAPPGPQRVRPVEVAVDGERRAEPAGTGAEQPVGDAAPAGAHRRDAVHRRQGADEHRRTVTLGLADQVGAPVEAVAAVDVEVPRAGRTSRRRGPSGRGSCATPGRPAGSARSRRSCRRRRPP